MSNESVNPFAGNKAEGHEKRRPKPHAEAIAFIDGLLPEKAVIVDIGAGGGNAITRHLLAKGHHMTLVEPSDTMRAQLIENIGRGADFKASKSRIVAGDASSTQLEPQSVDAIVMSNSARWVAQNDLSMGLREFQRILKPGGKIIISGTHPDNREAVSLALEELYERHSATRNLIAPREQRPVFSLPKIARRFIADNPPQQFERAFNFTVAKDEFIDLQHSRSFFPANGSESLDAELIRFFDKHARKGEITLGYKASVIAGSRPQRIAVTLPSEHSTSK